MVNTLSDIQSILNKIKEIETMPIKSEYKYDGKRVPRVTEILSSMVANNSLLSWANSLGFKRVSYSKYIRDVADKGTFSHMAIERFIKDGITPYTDSFTYPPQSYSVIESTFNAFMNWWNMMHEKYKKIELVYSEETLICEYFGGTCDCVLKVDGKYWLIDYKTSNHMNYKYVLQLAAYRYMLKKLKNIDVSVCMVLRLDKTNSQYYTYELHMNNDEHKMFVDDCLETFFALVLGFNMRSSTTKQYNNIFKDEIKATIL